MEQWEVTPCKYKINEEALIKDFRKQGFKIYPNEMVFEKSLYKHGMISMKIIVDKEDYFVRTLIYNTGTLLPYHPFYLPELRHHNLVYAEVVNNFNSHMDRLVTFGLFKKEKTSGKRKTKKRRRRKYTGNKD